MCACGGGKRLRNGSADMVRRWGRDRPTVESSIGEMGSSRSLPNLHPAITSGFLDHFGFDSPTGNIAFTFTGKGRRIRVGDNNSPFNSFLLIQGRKVYRCA
jgi:hypothetical protein